MSYFYQMSPGRFMMRWPHACVVVQMTPRRAWLFHKLGRFLSERQILTIANRSLTRS